MVLGITPSTIVIFLKKGFIAPNPFSEFLTITGLQEGMKVRIFNLYGTLLYDGTASKKMEKIETDKWASGSYFVEVNNADQRSISFLVKQ